MPKPRAYIETTVPNFYYDFRPSPEIERRREATRRWWVTAAEQYELVTSLTVRSELAAGTSNRVTQRLALLEGIRLIEFVPPVAEIVRHYLAHKLMPSKPQADAIHLALASYYECDFIVSWNSRHLANPNKVEHIRKISTRLGLHIPKLVTPLDLLAGESDDGRLD